MTGKKNIDDTDSYELDLDETSNLAVDDVIEDAARAVEAVEDRHREAAAGAASAGATSGNGAFPPSAAAPAESKESEDAAAMRERYLRVLADFDNYRKRIEREHDSVKRRAAADVLRAMLETTDNLERAITAGGTVEELKSGLSMVLRQQEDLFRRHGATRIEAVGKSFDPKIHEAVMREESAEVSSPTVVAEFQRGYLLYDQLLRPALVRVAVPAARPAEDPESR